MISVNGEPIACASAIYRNVGLDLAGAAHLARRKAAGESAFDEKDAPS